MTLNKTKEELEATDNIATLSLRCCKVFNPLLQICFFDLYQFSIKALFLLALLSASSTYS